MNSLRKYSSLIVWGVIVVFILIFTLVTNNLGDAPMQYDDTYYVRNYQVRYEYESGRSFKVTEEITAVFTVSGKHGIIRDLPWTKTFIVKSVQAQRDVVPIHFEGQNSDFFYNLANACKLLGIKFNIAMLYLADEMLKNRHKTFTVTIGKPIPWQTFDRSRTPLQWAQYVKDTVYKL